LQAIGRLGGGGVARGDDGGSVSTGYLTARLAHAGCLQQNKQRCIKAGLQHKPADGDESDP